MGSGSGQTGGWPTGTGRHPPAPPTVRGNRDFRLLWLAQTVTTTGSMTVAVAVPLLVLRATGSVATAGLVGFGTLAAAAVASLPGGTVADRYHRRAVLVGCLAAGAVALGVLALAVRAGAAPVALVLALAAVEAALRAPLSCAGTAALPHLVPAEQLPTALAAGYARLAAAALAGPPIGGALFEVSPALPFGAAGLGFLAGTACVLAIRTPLPAPGQARGTGLLAGLVFLWRDGFLRRVTLIHAVDNTVFSAVPLVVVAVGVGQRAGGGAIGLVYTVAGAGALVGSVLATTLSRRLPPWPAILVACGVPAGLLALAATAPSLGTLAAALTLSSAVTPLAGSVVGAVRILRTPDALQGRVQAAVSLTTTCTTPVGPLAGGVLLGRAGVAATLLGLAAVLAALAVAASLSPQIRGRR